MTKLCTLLLAFALAACAAAPKPAGTADACKNANPANASYGDGC